MSDENAKLANEISDLKKKLDKVEGQNAELTKQNTEMEEKNAKLLEKIEKMEAGKFQREIPTKQIAANSNHHEIPEKKSKDLEEKMDEKSPKLPTRKSVSNWLIDSLPWIKRKELADSKLSTSCEAFRQLCWPKLHGNVKPHNIDYILEFGFQYNKSNGIYQDKLKGWKEKNEWEYIEWDIPIASIQPPNYITGFDKIKIHFLNGQIMQFIECILPKLNGFCLSFLPVDINICNSVEQFGQIRRLFQMLAMKAVTLSDDDRRFTEFVRFNPNAFGLIENVQAIRGIELFDDNKEDIDLLVKWLVKSRSDQRPKLLQFYLNNALMTIFISKIKEQFIGSNQSANFIMPIRWGIDPNFILDNEKTGEVLALYDNMNANQQPWPHFREARFLVRHQKDKEHLRADWEEQFDKLININSYVIVGITGIGKCFSTNFTSKILEQCLIDENSKLINEMNTLKENLEKAEKQNTELTKKNNEMKEQNAKLLEKIEKMEAENFQQEIPTQQIVANSNLQEMLEEKSKDLEEKMDKKSPKLLKRKSVSVSNWLIDSLPWIKRKEMADSKLSTSCEIFRQLCWPKLHGNVKPHNIDYILEFGFQYNQSNGIYQAKLKGWKEKNEWEIIEWDIPIASIQPPNYITGFDKIKIHFLNGQIMQFIECILTKLNGFCLTFDSIEVNICNSDDNFGQIQRLFKMLAKKAFSLGCGFADFLRFNQNAFGLIENVQSMKEIQISHQEDIELLVKWLNKSLADDQKPKLLEFNRGEAVQINLIEKIKEQFIGTSQPANFIISFGWGPADYPNFIMENDQTGEVLALYPNQNAVPNANRHQWDYISRLFLIRHAKGEEQIKSDWEKQILQLEKLSLPYVIVGIAGIGEF